VVDYLHYYCDPDQSFDFAVMLKGRWGPGKTYLIKNFLEERLRGGPAKKDLYVSLYGLSSFQQIDDALYRQLYPRLASKTATIVETATKTALKTARNIDLNLSLRSFFEPPKGHLLVFDDLERCSIPISDALGYINHFVEHRDCKVIILANEDEILKGENITTNEEKARHEGDDVRCIEVCQYRQIKEKLTGQTLAVNATPRSALKNFLDLIRDDKTKKFLKNKIDDILLLHSQSETNNLRLLKQSLWDFEHLAICFSEKHWANDEAIGILFRVVLPLSFETRSGGLEAKQFDELNVSRYTRYWTTKHGVQSIADKLDKQYPETNFDQTIIPPELLKKVLCDGWADKDAIRNALDLSSYYAPPGTEPAWRTAWHTNVIDDDTFEEAVAKVEDQFKKRDFTIPGEMFHVFGLRLLFSEIGAIDVPKAEIVRECKQYLDELRDGGAILNKYKDKYKISISEGRGSLGFQNESTKEFDEILSHYRRIVDEVAVSSLPRLGRELLDILGSDPQKYFRMLCVNDFEQAIYHDVPILAAIPATDFVEEVLKLEAKSQATVFTAFRARYERSLSDLLAEWYWLAEVKCLFEEKAKNLRPLSRYRILGTVRHNIEPFLVSENTGSGQAQTTAPH
jgi:hypothetical protein